MSTRYFLSFLGTTAPQQPIDPATFAVVVRYELLEPEDDEPLPWWTATNENGRGTVVDSLSAVYGGESLEGVVTRLAGAGFKKVSVDMASVPIEERPAPSDDGPLPF